MYRFLQFCMRFWSNFFSVFWFWIIFSTVLRFLIGPNAPPIILLTKERKIHRGIFASLFRFFMVEILKLKSRNLNEVANESFTQLQFIRPYSIYEAQAGRFQWKVWFFFFYRLFQCSESIGDKRLCLIRRRLAGFIKSRDFPTYEMGTGGLLRLFFLAKFRLSLHRIFSYFKWEISYPFNTVFMKTNAKPFPYACALEPRRRFVTEAMPNFNLSIWVAWEVMGAA